MKQSVKNSLLWAGIWIVALTIAFLIPIPLHAVGFGAEQDAGKAL